MTIHSDGVGEYMLTTTDNPYNPFTEWDEWYAFDERARHHTCGLLARVVATSDDLHEVDQDEILAAAMDEIVRENVSGVHQKVSRSDFES